jgi:hypothetical protein
MRRDGAELMKRSKQWRQMCGSWMKRNGRIFGRLLEEVNGSLVSNLRENASDGGEPSVSDG